MSPKYITRFIFLLSLLLTYSCDDGEEQTSPQPPKGGRGGGPGGWGGAGRPGGRGAAAIPVKGEKVTRSDMSAYVETYARLEAERQVSVLARTTGLLEELSVEEGTEVEQGQILLRLDKEELNLRLRQAKAAYEEANANYERIAVLHEQRMVSQTEYETTRLRFANARLGLEEVQLNLDHTDLEAPISGVITQRLVEVGDLVRNNQEVFVIADLDPLLVRIFIPERRMYQLHPGQEATIAVEALPERSFHGKIRMISPEVDPESGTVKATLEVDSNGLLKPGMFATVRIITERRPQTLTIPKKALVLETDEDDVFLIVEGKVRRVTVELGFVEGDQVEVLSGLKEDDLVVTVGHEGLKDDVSVRLAGEGSDPETGTAPPDGKGSKDQWEGRGGEEKKYGGQSGQPPQPGRPGGGPKHAAADSGLGQSPSPDTLRKTTAESHREGSPLPDSLREKSEALRTREDTQ